MPEFVLWILLGIMLLVWVWAERSLHQEMKRNRRLKMEKAEQNMRIMSLRSRLERHVPFL